MPVARQLQGRISKSSFFCYSAAVSRPLLYICMNGHSNSVYYLPVLNRQLNLSFHLERFTNESHMSQQKILPGEHLFYIRGNCYTNLLLQQRQHFQSCLGKANANFFLLLLNEQISYLVFFLDTPG